MQDIGTKLLQSVGYETPSAADVEAAIKLNDTFVAGLERIRDQAQGVVEHESD